MPVDPYIGEIMMFTGTFVPQGWAACNGALVQISEFQALYSLIGTTYGGDGRVTFALPNMNGRAPVGTGAYPGMPAVRLGEQGGTPITNLTQANLPAHTHAVVTPAIQAPLAGSATGPITASNDTANNTGPGNKYLGQTAGGAVNEQIYVDTISVAKTMASTATVDLSSGQASIPSQTYNTAATGNGDSFSNLPPYLGMQFCIAVDGTYPPRP